MRRNNVKEPLPTMNDEITASELRVVTPSPKGKDEPLGIMSLQEALDKAKEMGGLDLILINNNSDPPVGKIVDYSKYRYEQEKKQKEIKKNSKASELKEVKMSYKIDVHDLSVRKNNARKFLKSGNRVKCTVMFRGREVQHDQLGVQLLEKLAADLEDLCVREGRPKRDGRNLSLILGPKPEVLKAVNDSRKAEAKEKKKKKAAAFESGAETAGVIDEEQPSDRIVEIPDEEDDDDDDEEEEPSLEELLGVVGDDLFG